MRTLISTTVCSQKYNNNNIIYTALLQHAVNVISFAFNVPTVHDVPMAVGVAKALGVAKVLGLGKDLGEAMVQGVARVVGLAKAPVPATVVAPARVLGAMFRSVTLVLERLDLLSEDASKNASPCELAPPQTVSQCLR